MSDYARDDVHRAYDHGGDCVHDGHDYSIRDVRDYDNIRGRGDVYRDRARNNIHVHDGDDARDDLYVPHDGDHIHSVHDGVHGHGDRIHNDHGRGVHGRGDHIHNVHGDVRDDHDVYVYVL